MWNKDKRMLTGGICIVGWESWGLLPQPERDRVTNIVKGTVYVNVYQYYYIDIITISQSHGHNLTKQQKNTQFYNDICISMGRKSGVHVADIRQGEMYNFPTKRDSDLTSYQENCLQRKCDTEEGYFFKVNMQKKYETRGKRKGVTTPTECKWCVEQGWELIKENK